MKVKQGKSVIWLFLKIPIGITISMESSRQGFFIDMIVDSFILKKRPNYALLLFHLHPKQVWDYFKQGIVSTV